MRGPLRYPNFNSTRIPKGSSSQAETGSIVSSSLRVNCTPTFFLHPCQSNFLPGKVPYLYTVSQI
jgi:hypothetical protein